MLRILLIISTGLLTTNCSVDQSYDHNFSLDESQLTLANEQADLGVLIAAAESIASWHAESQTGIELNSPLSDQAYSELVSEFPCTLPRELETLWKWKDGESTDYFVWYHGFLPLREAVEQYRVLRSDSLFGWQQNWIPIFQFQDEWNFVECSSEPTVGAPLNHYFTESGPSYAYTNLTTYLGMMAAATERGVLTWTDSWWSSSDDVNALAAVHKKFNHLAKFPYAVE